MRLHWRTCVIATCPIHKTFLQTTDEVKREDLLGRKRPIPQAAPMSLLRLDAMTSDAIRGRSVSFNGHKIAGGMWMRLLRTVLDELSTVLISATSESDVLRSVWQEAGVTTRVRRPNWWPFEHLAPDERRANLLAASTAFEMIGAGRVKPAGDDAKLLQAPKKKSKTKAVPIEKVLNRRKPSEDHRLHKQRARARSAFAWAKRDPKGARYVREILMSNGRDEVKEAFLDYALCELGIATGLVITDGMSIGVDKGSLSHWAGRRIYLRR